MVPGIPTATLAEPKQRTRKKDQQANVGWKGKCNYGQYEEDRNTLQSRADLERSHMNMDIQHRAGDVPGPRKQSLAQGGDYKEDRKSGRGVGSTW